MQQCQRLSRSRALSLARVPSLSSARLPARTNRTHCGHGAARTAVHRTANLPLNCSAAPGAVAREPQQLRVVGHRLTRLRGSATGVLRGVLGG